VLGACGALALLVGDGGLDGRALRLGEVVGEGVERHRELNRSGAHHDPFPFAMRMQSGHGVLPLGHGAALCIWLFSSGGRRAWPHRGARLTSQWQYPSSAPYAVANRNRSSWPPARFGVVLGSRGGVVMGATTFIAQTAIQTANGGVSPRDDSQTANPQGANVAA
jgi:hypothetical protein